MKGQKECLDEKETDEQTPTTSTIGKEQSESTKKGRPPQESVEVEEQKALEELFKSLGLSQ
jgi:hypothetical protein